MYIVFILTLRKLSIIKTIICKVDMNCACIIHLISTEHSTHGSWTTLLELSSGLVSSLGSSSVKSESSAPLCINNSSWGDSLLSYCKNKTRLIKLFFEPVTNNYCRNQSFMLPCNVITFFCMVRLSGSSSPASLPPSDLDSNTLQSSFTEQCKKD